MSDISSDQALRLRLLTGSENGLYGWRKSLGTNEDQSISYLSVLRAYIFNGLCKFFYFLDAVFRMYTDC